MAFINKKDFSIVGYVVNSKLAEYYFECDDLIAPAISLLNKKGYKTKFCCSGHPYQTIETCALSEIPPNNEDGINILSVVPSKDSKDTPEWVDTKEYPYFVTFHLPFPEGLYVTFEEVYNFHDLPGDAYIDDENHGIYWNITEESTNDFNMVTRVYEMNKAFYEWVEKLESIK